MGETEGRSQPNYDVDHFDRWAPTYERSFMQRLYFGPVHARMFEQLLRHGPREAPGHIVDIGCGTGRLLRAASRVWPTARLSGVDPAEQMIAEARRLNPAATFYLGAAETLPFPDASADLVMTSLSFHHWADQEKGLREIARILRPSGLLCLADHTSHVAGLFGSRARSRDQTRTMMTSAGMTVVRQHRMTLRMALITVAQR